MELLAPSVRFQRTVSVFFLVVSTVLFVPAARGRDVELNGKHFVLPDGFELELVAAAPLVDRPIVADFDELGRLYVADSAGTSENVNRQLETRPHRIRRLEDSDGDGRFDRSVVFADKMMFPEGALWYEGSLYVAAPPSIWKLTDVDDDGVCDVREEWFQGKTLTGCANDLHGPYAGLDGRVYWCKGAFAEQTYERPGRPPFVTRAAHIFRARLDGSDVEPVMTGGMDNPIEVAFLPTGERFITTTFFQHPGGGRRDGLIHALYGGVYGKIHSVIEEHPRTGDVLPVLTHMGAAAPCGLTRYRSAGFGEDYRGDLFATLFNLHKVTRHRLVARGAGFESEDIDFLVCAELDFHPTDVLEDADGSLLVVDTGGWYKVCCPSSQLAKPDVLGAIYRVRQSGATLAEDPRGKELAWDASSAKLAERLADERPAVRDRAASRLVAAGSAAVPSLAACLNDSDSADTRRRAVWTLTGIDHEEARKAVRSALDDASASVRHAALHSIALWRDLDALPTVIRLLDSASPAIRRAAAEAAGRLENAAAVDALLRACAKAGDDRFLEHSLTYALIEIGDAQEVRRGLEADAVGTRRAALIALDQMRDGRLEASHVARTLHAADAVVRSAAIWVARRHPEWCVELRGSYRKLLVAAADSSQGLRDIERLLADLAHERSVQELLAEVLTDPKTNVSTRRSVLRTIAAARPSHAPAPWATMLAEILASPTSSLREDALEAARNLEFSAQDGAPLRTTLLEVARDDSLKPDTRLAALEALPPEDALPGGLFEFLAGTLAPDTPALPRARAARCLVRFTLSPSQREQLLKLVAGAGPLEITTLVQPFGQIEDPAIAIAYVDALARSPGRRAIGRDGLTTWLEKAPAAAHESGRQLLASLEADRGTQRTYLERLAKLVVNGDSRKGQTVFNGEKAACSTCHRIGYLGGEVGPDLTNIGKIRTEVDLLESIVYPSVTFVRSYEPFEVVTKNGDAWAGVLRDQSAHEIVLVTGPDATVRVPRSDVLEVRPATTSIMPAGLEEQLTEEELADLVAFLKGARW